MKDLVIDNSKGQDLEDLETPSLSLFLATSGQGLRRLDMLHWEHPLTTIQLMPAPPRVEIALPALLHPVRTLTILKLSDMVFKSFAQLLRVFRALPLIKVIWLRGVTVSHASAPERLRWPRSIVLTALGGLYIQDCSIPLHTLPSLVSIGLRGTPNSDASPVEAQKYSMTHHGGFLHPNHEDSLLQLARGLTNSHATLPDRSSQETFGCRICRHGQKLW